MVFSIPSFVGLGDPYVKRRVKDQRKGGKSFVTGAPKFGKNPDALFEKDFKSVHEGDPFIESTVADRRYQNAKYAKFLTPGGFKYSNPPQTSEGLGGYYGTIQKSPTRHETDYVVPRKGDPAPKPTAKPRQIYTAPARKGTFGFPGLTIGKEGTDYIASFYDQATENARKERKAGEKLIKGPGFKTGGRKGRTFDEGPATGVSTCFMLTKPLPVRKVKERPAPKKADKPWKPGGPTNQMPKLEYREDPFDKLDPRVGPVKKQKKGDDSSKAWKPNSSTDKFWYSSSIAFRRL